MPHAHLQLLCVSEYLYLKKQFDLVNATLTDERIEELEQRFDKNEKESKENKDDLLNNKQTEEGQCLY